MYFVYILFSESHSKFYIGQTQDFEARLKRHNDGYDGFTKPYRPWKKILVLEKPSRALAMELERKLKNLSKERLIAFINKYKTE